VNDTTLTTNSVTVMRLPVLNFTIAKLLQPDLKKTKFKYNEITF